MLIRRLSMAALFVYGVVLLLERPGHARDAKPAAAVEDISKLPKLALLPSDRILILAPHPDDEVLGCGGVIQKALAMKLPLRIVFLTYGDSNQWSFAVYRKHPVFLPAAVRNMGQVRHDEAVAASEVLGVPKEDLIFLGYPDFGTIQVWSSHWGKAPPARGLFTHVNAVPYANARRPGAPYKGEEILKDMTEVMREFKPTKIFVSHPSDFNPDHRALFLFTRVALWDLAKEISPELFPYLIHFRDWPVPGGLRPTQNLAPPSSFENEISWKVLSLSPEEISLNLKALQKHVTQYEYSPKRLGSFIRTNELFGDFRDVAVLVSTQSAELSTLPPDPGELTDEEKAAFVGLESRYVYLEGDRLVISITYSRPLTHETSLSVYVFGYKGSRPFAEMPKLNLRFGPLRHRLYDGVKEISLNNVEVLRKGRGETIKISLKALGDPEKVLTSVRTSMADVPLDSMSWRVIIIPDYPK